MTFHTSLLMGAFVWMYQSTTIWYPTLLANMKLQPLAFLLLLNAGGVIGSVAFGTLSEKWGGRRGAATLGMIAGILSAPVYLFSESSGGLMLGGVANRFLRVRGGDRYGISVGAFSHRCARGRHRVLISRWRGYRRICAVLIGRLQDAGTDLWKAMMWCIIGGGVFVVTLLWLGPETKGRSL